MLLIPKSAKNIKLDERIFSKSSLLSARTKEKRKPNVKFDENNEHLNVDSTDFDSKCQNKQRRKKNCM